ncbi:hypothetical protein PGT21_036091 [Puccinia graminis f. sp. tritici]|uniref:Uncharacterized protein n=1 Tax=Puccinia graminis f. sp. tritici TaxID=56615 RepID=A0A5B0QR85_PUCGR|nr:hypothetical protein PGT21_036091 [Puccinia graminis f. sp. tritici]KAA1123037.1 hypothetical protein PGTUg99_011838 [Puccinia graminis f. sp. tritici]
MGKPSLASGHKLYVPAKGNPPRQDRGIDHIAPVADPRGPSRTSDTVAPQWFLFTVVPCTVILAP